jgi:hypothetical protein
VIQGIAKASGITYFNIMVLVSLFLLSTSLFSKDNAGMVPELLQPPRKSGAI